MAIRLPALTRSAATATRLAPWRSSIWPPKKAPMISGTMPAAAAAPVQAALPVMPSTSHGSATAATALPNSVMPPAMMAPYTGARRTRE